MNKERLKISFCTALLAGAIASAPALADDAPATSVRTRVIVEGWLPTMPQLSEELSTVSLPAAEALRIEIDALTAVAITLPSLPTERDAAQAVAEYTQAAAQESLASAVTVSRAFRTAAR